MSNWTDPGKWAALKSATGCPVCSRGGPTSVLAGLEVSWVSMGEAAPMRGGATLLLRRHAIELHDLTDDESAAFMRDARRLSRAISDATHPVKMNYEIHGNTLPHLHMHFFPRYSGDPFEWAPVNPRAITEPVYAPGEFARVRDRVIELLGVDFAP